MLPGRVQRMVNEAGSFGLDHDEHGNRTVVYADAPLVKVRPEWMRTHGYADVIQPDGGLVLDSAGTVRYRLLHELPDGHALYERI